MTEPPRRPLRYAFVRTKLQKTDNMLAEWAASIAHMVGRAGPVS